jgi:CO/xanthine dehydrogenase FAD-binding subunit
MMFDRPLDLDRALSLLAGDQWSILSGGTDFYPALGGRPPSGNIMDISGLEGLRSIRNDGAHWEFGALVTWTDIVKFELPAAFDGLKLAALEIGSVQIQNRATLAGNICNASPAADGVPPLLTLDAKIRLSSHSGVRELPLSEFVTGNRKTELRSDELVTAILIPDQSAQGKSTFRKLGARKYLVISIAMVAVRIRLKEDNTITEIAVSAGSCSLVAQRFSQLETFLTGRKLTPETVALIDANYLENLSPIDDVRATSHYRMEAVLQLIRRTILDTSEQPV